MLYVSSTFVSRPTHASIARTDGAGQSHLEPFVLNVRRSKDGTNKIHPVQEVGADTQIDETLEKVHRTVARTVMIRSKAAVRIGHRRPTERFFVCGHCTCT